MGLEGLELFAVNLSRTLVILCLVEVDNHHVTVLRNGDVWWSNVAVNYASGVDA